MSVPDANAGDRVAVPSKVVPSVLVLTDNPLSVASVDRGVCST